MKKLTKLSLAHLSQQELSSKQLKEIKGGNDFTRQCKCSCYYADNAGSSIDDNCAANAKIGASGGNSVNPSTQCIEVGY